MKKSLFSIILLIVLSIPCYHLEAYTQPTVLKIGVYNNPPKISVSENGTASGYHIDIIEAILKDAPYKIEYVPGTWEDCLDRLKNGKIDIMPDVAWSPERAAVYDFNYEPLLINWAAVYSSKTAAIDIITDLDGKRVAVMKNSIHTEGESGIIRQVENYGIKCDFIFVTTYREAFDKIQNGVVDAAVVNRLFGLLNEEKYNVKRTTIIFNPSQLKYAFRKNSLKNKTLIELFDSSIIKLKADRDSIYYSSFSKYLLPQIRKEKKLPEWTVNIIFLVIILSVILSIYLISAESGKNESALLKNFFRENQSMWNIRSGITDHSLNAFALFSVPLFLSILYHGVSIGWDNIIWFYIPVTAIPVVTALFKKHLAVTFKITILILCMSLTGILVLKSWGRVGTGFTFFLTAGTIITLIYGKRSGLAIITTGLIITVVFGILTQYKILTYNYNMVLYSQSPSSWIFAIMVLFMMFFTIISGIEKFYENLVSAVDNLEQKVQQRTIDLDQVNKNLQKEIEIRQKIEEELISAQTEAEHANSAKGIFLANMSHEIRTPLNAILGYSQILLREKALPPEPIREIEIINSSGEHLLDLINEILDMSKIEAGKIELINETFSLYSVIKQINNLFAEKTDRKGIKFVTQISRGIPDLITSDKSKLKQILINLLGNAVKFTDNGSVKLYVTMSSGTPQMLIFTVTDTGEGIAPKNIEKIFAPFEQADDGKDRGGTGLGLSISRKYANLLGGDISVKSTINEGSCFTFTVPYIEGDAGAYINPVTEKKITGIRGGSSIPRVLVVDDRVTNRDILVLMLKPLGFSVKEASNGEEALETVSRWKPDLLLLDLIMPGLSGNDVIKKIKADPLYAELKIIVITASVLDIAKQEILESGADAFIRKPFKEITVLNEIGKIFNLEYIYEDQENNEEPLPAYATGAELAVMFKSIPSDIREYLKNALITGDIEEIRNSIEIIYTFNPDLAKLVNLRTEDFEFSSIIETLNNVGNNERL